VEVVGNDLGPQLMRVIPIMFKESHSFSSDIPLINESIEEYPNDCDNTTGFKNTNNKKIIVFIMA